MAVAIAFGIAHVGGTLIQVSSTFNIKNQYVDNKPMEEFLLP